VFDPKILAQSLPDLRLTEMVVVQLNFHRPLAGFMPGHADHRALQTLLPAVGVGDVKQEGLPQEPRGQGFVMVPGARQRRMRHAAGCWTPRDESEIRLDFLPAGWFPFSHDRALLFQVSGLRLSAPAENGAGRIGSL